MTIPDEVAFVQNGDLRAPRIALAATLVCVGAASAFAAWLGLFHFAIGLGAIAFALCGIMAVVEAEQRAFERIRIGPTRITGLRSLRRGAYSIDLHRAVVESARAGFVVREGQLSLRIEWGRIRNSREVALALRTRVRPEAWLRPRRIRRARSAVATPETAPTYRADGRSSRALPAWCTTERWARWRRMLVASAAVAVSAVALATTLPPRHLPVEEHRCVEQVWRPPTPTGVLRYASLALIGAALIVIGADVLTERSVHHALRWLGREHVADGACALRSGSRRIRLSSTCPASAYWETLDDQGRTLASLVASLPETNEPETPARLRSVAVLPRAIDSNRHFVAPPPAGPQTFVAFSRGAARVLVLHVHADGVVLHRYSECRANVGDTWHPTREHALSQIADEYGERDLVFVDVPFDPNEGPIAFFRHVDLGGTAG